MTPEKILRLLERKGLSLDSLIAIDRSMLRGEANLLCRFISLCAKPDENPQYWTILAGHVVMARATRHPYATVMESLYNQRSERYGHSTN